MGNTPYRQRIGMSSARVRGSVQLAGALLAVTACSGNHEGSGSEATAADGRSGRVDDD